MATIPKKLAFKLYFREKTKTRKLKYRQRRLQQLSKNTKTVFLQSFSYKPTSKYLDTVTNPYLLSIYDSRCFLSKRTEGKNGLKLVKQPLLPWLLLLLLLLLLLFPEGKQLFTKKGQKSNDVFYSKQKSDVWLINTNHVYLKTQTHCSVNSKKLLFGTYGICVVQYATISAAYIETIKLDIAKILKKKGRVWTRVCCDCPVSARPAETRMGKGKGSISHWVAKVRPGQLLFEFSGITKTQLNDIFQKLCKKTSIGLTIIS
uniref:ribosomal protein L16 n=1 Tax=Ulva meridionalis TaxID=434723 RepID=UPI002114B7B1|nr:ribosomal protein L16 [Ulva meridionalis]UTA96539.1 ribosomal protein L16 [Ulva meridionalis]UTA96597.1 ribosomal protein L16 [Ulva meridionalis]UTA96649.1 ribosomal protein L16 [Ulva meridionalis]UTA96701.1 ribosomal protein L16 [Ulva meridionalis]UTA96764.1 ribosomal protein L16 [Ulva meridionalis]